MLKKQVRVVSKQANDLKYMIDRMLVFSRLEAGMSHVRIQDFSLSKIKSP